MWFDSFLKPSYYGAPIIIYKGLCNPIAFKYLYLCKMKFITVILSVYFLALNFMPCGDDDDNTDDFRLETVADIDDNHNHSGNSDLCSPFCHCHCCHVHVVGFDLFHYDFLNPEVSSEIPIHFDGAGKDILNLPFQPPQL